jgi:hypothetical protein
MQTISRTHKAINKQLQEPHEVLQVPTMPNNARYFEVSPIHPRVMVGHSCWCLHSPWLSIQQKIDGNWWWSCSAVELLMMTWEVQFHKSSCITSYEGEVFRGIAEECHWWHTRPINLINTSQATRYLVLGDCKSASPGRNKIKFLTGQLVSTKRKTFANSLPPLQLRGLKTSFWSLLHIVLLSSRYIWGTSSNR